MNILFIGDIVGSAGRKAMKSKLQYFIDKYDVDFVIANGENITHGKGMIYRHYTELCDDGVDVITLGNHYNGKADLKRYIDDVDNIIRPINILEDYPGVGTRIFYHNGFSIRVTNVLGDSYLGPVNKTPVSSPYLAIQNILDNEEKADIHIIDFHGDSTSEKQIMGYVFDGEITALLGTHTHVQTHDARILENGTAFMCDVGMTGYNDGVIGYDRDSVINKIIYGSQTPFQIPDKGVLQFSGALLKVDEITGICKEIFTIHHVWEEK